MKLQLKNIIQKLKDPRYRYLLAGLPPALIYAVAPDKPEYALAAAAPLIGMKLYDYGVARQALKFAHIKGIEAIEQIKNTAASVQESVKKLHEVAAQKAGELTPALTGALKRTKLGLYAGLAGGALAAGLTGGILAAPFGMRTRSKLLKKEKK
jgi:hypothetical protein